MDQYCAFDYRALGLHPRGYDILIQLIDFQRGMAGLPKSQYILGYLYLGYSQREIARIMGVHHSTIQKRIQKIRKQAISSQSGEIAS